MSAKKAAPKPKPSASPAAARTLRGLLEGRGRAVALGVLIGALFFGSWYTVWNGVSQHVLSSEQYYLTLERVEITPPPPWIHTDIRAEVFRDASLDGPLSILDSDLVARIADAFSLHPWVAKIRRVSKHHPARVRVELNYRRPVCMVQVPGGLHAVDSEGVVLPGDDFSPIEASRYPRLVGVTTEPLGPVGTRWGDPVVVGAAQVTAAFGDDWHALGLDRIVASGAAPGHADRYTYDLFTRGGARIRWGRAPDDPMAGETPAAEKIARLKRHAREHGGLDGSHSPPQLDVPHLPSANAPHQTADAEAVPAR
ncbi:MAG: hypothetical protein HUU20_06210 [Pirellulales bacterium]|nr:hypothetical protein [Pirellulales bacterium]